VVVCDDELEEVVEGLEVVPPPPMQPLATTPKSKTPIRSRVKSPFLIFTTHRILAIRYHRQ
jgi:hypothetical protein